jgi:hypothetical protein
MPLQNVCHQLGYQTRMAPHHEVIGPRKRGFFCVRDDRLKDLLRPGEVRSPLASKDIEDWLSEPTHVWCGVSRITSTDWDDFSCTRRVHF